MLKNSFFIIMIFIISGCADEKSRDNALFRKHTIEIESPAFQDGAYIPKKYTADGKNISPPLLIKSVPDETKSMVLMVDDPDAPAGTWVHWIVFNIPSDIVQVSEGKEPAGLPGKNSWGRTGYSGPSPPHGHGVHGYKFKIYALNTYLDIKSGSDKKAVEEAMEGHVIDMDILTGKYSR